MVTRPRGRAAGRRNKRVRFEREADAGGGKLGYVPFLDSNDNQVVIWACIEPIKAGERWRFGQLQSGITHRISFLKRGDITADAGRKLRIVCGGRKFNVISAAIDTNERGITEEVMVQECFS